jgi:hypothetical protein
MTNNNFSWINDVSTKLIRKVKTNDGRKNFLSISIPFESSESGYASILIDVNQIYPNRNKNGVINDRFRNIYLGKSDALRKVSVLTDKDSGTYEKIDITNAEIAEIFRESRATYKNATKIAYQEAVKASRMAFISDATSF